MRAVVLSDERIINLLNDNYINTWIRSVELKRLRDTLEYKQMSPLARTIICNKWRRGPVDTWIITPELETIGHVDINEYLGNNRREDSALESENYLLFLKDSLAGKLPGLGNIVLTPDQPSQTVLDVFRTPEYGHQDYTVVVIDTTAFENGGTLTVDLELGIDKAYGSFFLLDAEQKLSFDADKKRPGINMFDDAHDIGWYDPCEIGQMTHRFEHGQIYKLVGMGWGSNEKGSINAFQATFSIEEN